MLILKEVTLEHIVQSFELGQVCLTVTTGMSLQCCNHLMDKLAVNISKVYNESAAFMFPWAYDTMSRQER